MFSCLKRILHREIADDGPLRLSLRDYTPVAVTHPRPEVERRASPGDSRPHVGDGASVARRNRAEGLGGFAENDTDCALALYRQLLHQPGNLLFSPFSIRAVFAMAYAGARGETAAQISGALRFASSTETLHVAFAEIIERLNAAGGGQYEMAVANSLWGQDGTPLQAGFLDLVARHYPSGMNVVDFLRDAEAARVAINRWVEDHTKQRIRELIPSNGLNPYTRLVLTNAVYFKGMWVRQFDKALTRDAPFYLESGGTVQASMMHQRECVRYPFPQMDDFQAVDLDYRGSDLSMLVLLPHRKDGLRDLEARLSARMLHQCVARMRAEEVMLFLPRFTITWGTAELGDSLRALGMPLAFTPLQADFSGINGHAPPALDSLFISTVYHKAFVEVNEEGRRLRPRQPSRWSRVGLANLQYSERTTRSCSPSAIGRAARSCFSGAWPTRCVGADAGTRCVNPTQCRAIRRAPISDPVSHRSRFNEGLCHDDWRALWPAHCGALLAHH